MAALDLTPDPTLVARNQQRADELKKTMGSRFVFHPSNRVQRLSPTNRATISPQKEQR